MNYTSIENPSIESLSSLSFDKLITSNAYSPKSFVIVVVGAGGTGGYVVPTLSRFIYSLKTRCDEFKIKLLLIDPDKVEEKNLLRQNFLTHDLGKNKAEVLAERHSNVFGIEIAHSDQLMTSESLGTAINSFGGVSPIPIVVGCVDNNKARREIEKYMRARNTKTMFWIDSGNERTSGQVIMGSTKGHPFVTDLYPEILDESNDSKEQISCADRAMQDEQNIFVNIDAASHVIRFVRSIILNEETVIHGVRFNIKGKVDNFCLQAA